MTIHRTLKLTLLNKVYMITTDEDEQCVLQAMNRVNRMLEKDTGGTYHLSGEIEKGVILAMLQLAVDLEKALNELQHIGGKVLSLEKVVSQSL